MSISIIGFSTITIIIIIIVIISIIILLSLSTTSLLSLCTKHMLITFTESSSLIMAGKRHYIHRFLNNVILYSRFEF